MFCAGEGVLPGFERNWYQGLSSLQYKRANMFAELVVVSYSKELVCSIGVEVKADGLEDGGRGNGTECLARTPKLLFALLVEVSHCHRPEFCRERGRLTAFAAETRHGEDEAQECRV